MTRAPAPAGYEDLAEVLTAALMQAAAGKGSERHGNGLPFAAQPMAEITRAHGLGFPLGQSEKKGREAAGMVARGEFDAARRELLGAINYVAGAVLRINAIQQARSATERAAEGALGVSGAQDTRQPVPGVWTQNCYSALHASIVGPVTDDGALFPSGWTPETDEMAVRDSET